MSFFRSCTSHCLGLKHQNRETFSKGNLLMRQNTNFMKNFPKLSAPLIGTRIYALYTNHPLQGLSQNYIYFYGRLDIGRLDI